MYTLHNTPVTSLILKLVHIAFLCLSRRTRFTDLSKNVHVYRPCLKLTIDHSKAEQVVCPYIDEKYSCTGVLQHREIKKVYIVKV